MLSHSGTHAHRRPAALVVAVCAMLWLTFLPSAAGAQPIVVKMATLVPDGTS